MAEGKLYVTLDRIKLLEFSVESMLYSLSRCKVPLVKVRFLACIVSQISSMQAVLGKKSTAENERVVQMYYVQNELECPG